MMSHKSNQTGMRILFIVRLVFPANTYSYFYLQRAVYVNLETSLCRRHSCDIVYRMGKESLYPMEKDITLELLRGYAAAAFDSIRIKCTIVRGSLRFVHSTSIRQIKRDKNAHSRFYSVIILTKDTRTFHTSILSL